MAVDDYRVPDDARELLRVDDAMREFFAQRVPKRASDHERLEALVKAILEPDGLGFVYDAEGTFDPRETFRRRRGNCASFSFLVVAVARDLGFDASFQSIARPTRWNRVDAIVLAILHLDVRLTTRDGVYIVDLQPDVAPPRDSDEMHVISDERAYAQFYCNIGFQQLVRDRPQEALRYMTLATRIDPNCAGAWANRGTLQARLGDLAAAKASFEHSLRADPRGEAALDGFIGVLRQIGSPDALRKADKLERRARAVRERNPYYQQHLALRAQEQGDLAAAEKRLRRAIALKDDEPEFYAQWKEVLEQQGRRKDAQRAERKLAHLRERLGVAPTHFGP